MDIDITSFFTDADPFEYSASQAERGINAGRETWRNAKERAAESPLLKTPDEIEALRLYVKDFGAWSDEEIAAWSDVECNALFIQLISGDIREGGLAGADLDDTKAWSTYEERAKAGCCNGNLYKSGINAFCSLSH